MYLFPNKRNFTLIGINYLLFSKFMDKNIDEIYRNTQTIDDIIKLPFIILIRSNIKFITGLINSISLNRFKTIGININP